MAKLIAAKELFEHYNGGLVNCLPMKDVEFLELLKERKLLPDDVKNSLEKLVKTTERSSYFLDMIIKQGLDNDDDSHFINLLDAMKKSSYDVVRDLALKIQKELGVDQMRITIN